MPSHVRLTCFRRQEESSAPLREVKQGWYLLLPESRLPELVLLLTAEGLPERRELTLLQGTSGGAVEEPHDLCHGVLPLHVRNINHPLSSSPSRKIRRPPW